MSNSFPVSYSEFATFNLQQQYQYLMSVSEHDRIQLLSCENVNSHKLKYLNILVTLNEDFGLSFYDEDIKKDWLFNDFVQRVINNRRFRYQQTIQSTTLKYISQLTDIIKPDDEFRLNVNGLDDINLDYLELDMKQFNLLTAESSSLEYLWEIINS